MMEIESLLSDHTTTKMYMDLVYNEVEVAISEKNPPFAALIVDQHGNILSTAPYLFLTQVTKKR